MSSEQTQTQIDDSPSPEQLVQRANEAHKHTEGFIRCELRSTRPLVLAYRFTTQTHASNFEVSQQSLNSPFKYTTDQDPSIILEHRESSTTEPIKQRADDNNQRQFFEKLQAALRTENEKLLRAFSDVENAIRKDASSDTSDFSLPLLTPLNEFEADCATCCAALLREASVVPETRGTPTKVLANESRSLAFGKLDALLVRACNAFEEANKAADASLNAPTSSGVDQRIGTVLKGALAGGLVGAALDRKAKATGALVGAAIADRVADVEADEARANAASRAVDSARQQLMEAGKVVEATIQEWIQAYKDVPEALLDWVGAKTFGPQINLDIQRQYVALISKDFQGQAEKALQVCELIHRHREALNEQRNETLKLETEKEKKRNKTLSTIVTIVAVLIFAAIAIGMVVSGDFAKDGVFIGLMACALLTALVMFLLAVFSFVVILPLARVYLLIAPSLRRFYVIIKPFIRR